ncbi:hypothetical protein DdX_16633 [Ditylenchus destructor]|uniref:Uncharacterized protein n=1 Tax=Ditylenchus destructor TaxID=166010 RepID=A0AAD4MMR4_9BILA|nr:hypothetical protein DdX_16633 [Ditylenchus destructor]
MLSTKTSPLRLRPRTEDSRKSTYINKDQVEKFEKDITAGDLGYEWNYNELSPELLEEFSELIKLKKEDHSEGQNSTPRTNGSTLTEEEELKMLDEWANS